MVPSPQLGLPPPPRPVPQQHLLLASPAWPPVTPLPSPQPQPLQQPQG